METMSNILAVLSVFALLASFVFLVILIIRLCIKKFDLWLIIATAASVVGFIVFIIASIATDPSTYREHEWKSVEKVEASCTSNGYELFHCDLCNGELEEPFAKLGHDLVDTRKVEATEEASGEYVRSCTRCGYEEITVIEKLPKETSAPCKHQYEISEEVAPTCTENGKIINTCSLCGDEVVEQVDSTGHSMKEISRIEPTYAEEGSIVSKCEKCDTEVTETLTKLDPIVIIFDDLQLTFGQYSFTTVKNKYSQYNGKSVVKIPVTVKNLSKDPHSLNMFSYSLFGADGVECDSIGYYFDDDVGSAGDLLPGKSYEKYFYILYDNDGIYTISFSTFLDQELVEILVKK